MRLPILLLTLLAASTTASSTTSSNTATVSSPNNSNLRRVQNEQQQHHLATDGTRALKKDELVLGASGGPDDEKPDNKPGDKKKGEPEVDPRGPDEVMLAEDVGDIVDGLPTGSPSKQPTEAPTESPTRSPSSTPSLSPTTGPTSQPTTAGPSTSPTSSPTTPPSSSPTFTPGSVERFFCTEDVSPLSDEFCDEDWADKWYNDLESCGDKCKGKKECVSKRCVTETPTLSPTLSGMPSVSTMPSEAATTNSPTSSPSVDVLAGVAAASTLIPTEDDLSDAAAATGGITWNDLEDGSTETTSGDASAGEAEEEVSLTTTSTVLPPKFEFTGGDEEASTESIPMSSFKLDLVVAKTNGNEGGRKQLRFLRGDKNKRQLQGESSPLFQTNQDLELVGLTSKHLRRHFKKNLEGEPNSVELGILEKSEQFIGTGEVNGLENSQGVDTIMVSYEMIGYAVYERPDDSTALPTTDELDAEVLKAFNDNKGQQAWLNSMSRSDDEVLHGIIDVEASRPLPLAGIAGGSGLDPSKAVENSDSDTIEGASNSDGTSGELTVPFVILIATAFAATFMVIGFLTYRKYQRYQRNNRNNDYVSYQNRKRKISIDAKSRNFTQKQYDHLESLDGSAVDQSEDPIYNDLEIVGGDTFPTSQENSNSDVDPSSPCKQFNPQETVPYDEADTSGRMI